jgi:AcrR family transcriptional regulator
VSSPDPGARRPSAAKQRLLEVADELFYAEGINTVGIDRIIAQASVTKATFYKQYGSKDALIIEYIHGRDRQAREQLESLVADASDAGKALEGYVAAIVSEIDAPGFRGCAFINAAAEFSNPNHPVRRAVLAHREWLTESLDDLLRETKHPFPGNAADELLMLRDGAMAGAYAGDAIAATSALTRTAKRVLKP